MSSFGHQTPARREHAAARAIRIPRFVAVVAALAWAALTVGEATAGMYFYDSFESPPYTRGPLPPSALVGGYYTTATSGIIGTNGWQAGGYTSNPAPSSVDPKMPDPFGQNAYVVANPNTSGSPSSGIANTSANAVALVGNSSGGDVHPSEVRVQPSGYSPTFPTISLAFDMLFPSGGVGTDHSEAIVGFLGLNWSFGNYGFYNAGTDTTPQPRLTFAGSDLDGFWNDSYLANQYVDPNVWHRIEVTVDTGAKTALYKVDNAVVGTYDVSSYLKTGFSQFNVWMDGSGNNENAVILMDNVLIVPEPSQMVFVASLGAVFGAWRLRKTASCRRHSPTTA